MIKSLCQSFLFPISCNLTRICWEKFPHWNNLRKMPSTETTKRSESSRGEVKVEEHIHSMAFIVPSGKFILYVSPAMRWQWCSMRWRALKSFVKTTLSLLLCWRCGAPTDNRVSAICWSYRDMYSNAIVPWRARSTSGAYQIAILIRSNNNNNNT